MKVLLSAPFAALLFFFSACEQKSPPVASSSPRPSSIPTQTAEAPDYSGVTSNSLAEVSPQDQATPSASPSVAATNRPVFHSEAATQVANQYLNSYIALRNSIDNAPKVPLGNPEAITSTLQTTLQQLARNNAELQNQQREVDRQLTPDEKKRLLQYQKSLEQGGQE